jgi:hypothetical protein
MLRSERNLLDAETPLSKSPLSNLLVATLVTTFVIAVVTGVIGISEKVWAQEDAAETIAPPDDDGDGGGGSDVGGSGTLDEFSTVDSTEAPDRSIDEPAPPPSQPNGRTVVVAPAGSNQGTNLIVGGGVGFDGQNIKKICKCSYVTDVPYSERRNIFGFDIAISAGTYNPTNYVPNFTSRTYSDYYNGNKGVLAMLNLSLKWNFALGSIGPVVGGGFFSARNSGDDSTLNVYPIEVGGMYSLDNLFSEPYVVPYGFGGMYMMYYSETVGGLSVRGNTASAPYFGGGLRVQIDWIDPDAHDRAYQDFGLQSTYIFAEAKSYSSLGANTIPNLSSSVAFQGGLMVEF